MNEFRRVSIKFGCYENTVGYLIGWSLTTSEFSRNIAVTHALVETLDGHVIQFLPEYIQFLEPLSWSHIKEIPLPE